MLESILFLLIKTMPQNNKTNIYVIMIILDRYLNNNYEQK